VSRRVCAPYTGRRPFFAQSATLGVPIRIVSYNLRKHQASDELSEIVASRHVDVLCLQECFTTLLPERIGDLVLADATKRNRLGLAIYYRDDRFTARNTTTFVLKKSLYDRLFEPTHERLIATKLFDAEAQREIVIASFHASPLTAGNSLRRNQIRAAHAALRGLGDGLPSVMVGDYNYPLFKDKLMLQVSKSGYDLTLSDLPTYLRYKIFKGHFDFVTSNGMTINSVETLARGASDHAPILLSASMDSAPPTQKASPGESLHRG
jgi:endonuclease/exonuclease/phosphatase family metal-dependent hydrolase